MNQDLVRKTIDLLSQPIGPKVPTYGDPIHARPTSNGQPVTEPACRPDGQSLSPIYWETGAGAIVGPAIPECFLQAGSGLKETDFWIVVSFEAETVWVRVDRLRSRRQFEQQKALREIELVKEPR